MSTKFDEEAYNDLVSIVFTRSKRDGHTHGRTEPQQRYYIPSATRCARIMRISWPPSFYISETRMPGRQQVKSGFFLRIKVIVNCQGQKIVSLLQIERVWLKMGSLHPNPAKVESFHIMAHVLPLLYLPFSTYMISYMYNLCWLCVTLDDISVIYVTPYRTFVQKWFWRWDLMQTGVLYVPHGHPDTLPPF